MLVLKLSMTFESGLLPTRHFLEANTTHSFYSVHPLFSVAFLRPDFLFLAKLPTTWNFLTDEKN
jgi:hypothetical protein